MSPLPGTITINTYMPEAVSWTDRDARQWHFSHVRLMVPAAVEADFERWIMALEKATASW